jgi:integrase
MPNIELRNNTWFATLHVPHDVRETLGKSKLIRTLQTPDKRLAQERALPILAEWKALIRNARGSTDGFTSDALRWRESVRNAVDDTERETLELLVTDKAEALEESKGYPAAKVFADIALGVSNPIEPLIAPWESSLADLAPKTRSVYVPTIKKMAIKFKTLEAIDRRSVRAWILEMQETLSGSTIQRILGACNNLWEWLQARDMVDIDSTPFKGHNVKTKKQSYKPFTPDEVVTLWTMATEKGNQPLADLIHLGGYTGGRIEELCSIKVEHVTQHHSILLPGTKTDNAAREVPIHRNIRRLIKRLSKDSKDGFLIPSSANNSRGNRSDPHSKTFGRLKGELGYEGDRTRVFHSIRKTLTTMLENAGVPENVAADIVGHEKNTMTYGLYSGGNALEVKRVALEKVAYKGM